MHTKRRGVFARLKYVGNRVKQWVGNKETWRQALKLAPPVLYLLAASPGEPPDGPEKGCVVIDLDQR